MESVFVVFNSDSPVLRAFSSEEEAKKYVRLSRRPNQCIVKKQVHGSCGSALDEDVECTADELRSDYDRLMLEAKEVDEKIKSIQAEVDNNPVLHPITK